MPLMRAPCLFLATVLAAPLAFAGTEQDPLNVFNEMAGEAANCAAYYGVVSIALENRAGPGNLHRTISGVSV